MNRLLKTLVILFFFTSDFTFAQNSKVEIGIEGGPNFSPFRDNSKASTTSSVLNRKSHGNYAGSIGIRFQWNSRKYFAIRTGITYEQKSFTVERNTSDVLNGATSHSKKYNTFDYLTLPLLGRFTFGNKVHFFLNAGVFLGYLSHQNEVSEYNSTHISGDQSSSYESSSSTNNIELYNRFDFGLIGGLGVGLPIKKHWYFSLEARENLGVMNIVINPDYFNPVTKTSSFGLLLGISYKLGFREEKK